MYIGIWQVYVYEVTTTTTVYFTYMCIGIQSIYVYEVTTTTTLLLYLYVYQYTVNICVWINYNYYRLTLLFTPDGQRSWYDICFKD